MSETQFAVLGGDGTAVNVIIADQAFADAYDHPTVRIDQLDPRPGIGWSYAAGKWTPPPTLEADRYTIPADNATPAVLTLRRTRGAGPVTFVVNGLEVSRPVVKGDAVLEVTSATPGDTIIVTADGLAATITVEA